MTYTVARAIAAAIAREGVTDVFGVMGHGNLYWLPFLEEHGARFHMARHEGNAMVMADGYARVSGDVAVCTVTQGPGLGNAFTGLVTAQRARSPLVLLAGAVEQGHQAIDQPPIYAAAGVRTHALRGPDTIHEDLAEAFRRARTERTVIAVDVPGSMLAAPAPEPPAERPAPVPEPAPVPPPAAQLDAAAELLRAAQRPVILAGKGAVWAQAGPRLEELADRVGALLVTTLRAKGLFADHPWSLGISGGFSSELGRELLGEADCLVAFGSSFDPFTLEGGELYAPDVAVVRCDVAEPADALATGAFAPVVGDARLAAEGLLERLGATQAGWRSPELAERLAAWAPEEEVDRRADLDGLDPRLAAIALEKVLPRDRVLVLSGGHCQGWGGIYGNVADPACVIHPFEFGSVGLGLGQALGAGVARRDLTTVCYLGDGDLLMGLADLDSATRFGVPLVLVVFNDRGYGSEVHTMRDLGLDPAYASFSTPDFAGLAEAAGGQGVTITDLAQIPPLADRITGLEGLLLLDVRIDGDVRALWDERLQARMHGHATPEAR